MCRDMVGNVSWHANVGVCQMVPGNDFYFVVDIIFCLIIEFMSDHPNHAMSDMTLACLLVSGNDSFVVDIIYRLIISKGGTNGS